MTSKELTQIKKYQREFKKQFNKELIIDFIAMNGVVDIKRTFGREKFSKKEADKILNSMCKKYNADINVIKDRKERLAFNYPNETRAVANYVKECLKERWGVKEIMLHINRERTDAYYYIKKIAKINLVD
jgi:hypothetical protein